jgi:hypothetical protein
VKNSLQRKFEQQEFDNGYQLVNGVAMHAENGDRFQIPHTVLKKHVRHGHFVEVRIDSPRFSAHPDAPARCTCPHCNEAATKPILSHEHPASLLELPRQNVPSRGWGEDFWVQIKERDRELLRGTIDNPLYEARLHGLDQGDEFVLHDDHILAVHASHRRELILGMNSEELKELAQWLGSQRD